ncbi:MAG: transglycosylase SLT domain-containing protein [Bryobacteraceae bacterium]
MMYLHSAPTIPVRWFKWIVVALVAAALGMEYSPAHAAQQKKAPQKKSAPARRTATKAAPAKKAAPKKAAAPQAPIIYSSGLEGLVKAYRAGYAPARRAALEQYAASNAKDQNGALALLALGLIDYERNNYPTAVTSLRAAQSRLPRLSDYAAYAVAASEVEIGNYTAALAALDPVWKSNPVSPFVGRAALLAARAHTQLNEPSKAIEVLHKHSRQLPQPAGEMARAAALEAAGSLAAAADAYQGVYYHYPTSSDAERAASALAALRERMGPDYPPAMPQALLTRASRLLDAKQYAAARREFDRMIPQLGGAEQDIARVRVGAADYHANRSSEALRYLRALSVSAPEADAERLYYIVAAARRLDNDAEMERAIAELDRNHPTSGWRRKALSWAGNRYLVTYDWEKYEPLYRACYQGFPDDSESAYCHWKVTWLHYIQRRPGARQMLADHVRRYPGSEKAGAALYFLGRIAEQSRDYAAARLYHGELADRFPNSYYGVLARERLQEPQISRASASQDVALFLQQIEFPDRTNSKYSFDQSISITRRIERSRLLAAAGLEDHAENELRFGARNEGSGPLLAMELAQSAQRRGAHDQSIRYIISLVPGYLYLPPASAPDEFWRLAFPMPFRNSLERYARQNALDPAQVAALIRQESLFNPRALSRAKAYGLTQVMPATGREVSRRVGINGFHSNLLFEPDTNLKIGTYYLRSRLDVFNGQWELALASYNAGKSRVDRWLTWADYREPAEFVETIPFTETRDYVQIVLRNADIYRRLYGDSSAAVLSTKGAADND